MKAPTLARAAVTASDDTSNDGQDPRALTGRQLREQLADDAWLGELIDRAGEAA